MVTSEEITCPNCGFRTQRYMNPAPTVDIIIEYRDGFILIQRKNPPYGWAIPGGFVDYNEALESAALREAKEETNLNCTLIHLLGVYSDPKRDPRGHTISTVFIAAGRGKAAADDDAIDFGIFTANTIPELLAFDHKRILQDYFIWKHRT